MLATITLYIIVIGWLGTGLLFSLLSILGIIEVVRKGVKWIGGKK